MAQQQQVAHVIQEYQSPTTQSSSRAAEREQVSISSKKEDAYLRYYWYYLVPTLYTVPTYYYLCRYQATYICCHMLVVVGTKYLKE